MASVVDTKATKGMTFSDDVDKKAKSKLDILLAKYDVDGNGEYDSEEVAAIIKDLQKSEGNTKKMACVSAALFVALLAMIAVMFVAVVVGNEASKENHTKGANMVTLDGKSVHTAEVESFATLWDMPKLDTKTLAYLNDLELRVDMTADPDVAGEADASFKIAAVWKPSGSTTKLFFSTMEGFTVTIDATASKGSIKMGSNVFPLVMPPQVKGRQLSEAQPLLVSREELEERLLRGRNLLGTQFVSASGSLRLNLAGLGRGRNPR